MDINKHSYEVSISLFETCNLNCKFCFERHNVPINKEAILKSASIITDGILQDLIDYNIQQLYLRYWGGELFQDSIDDSLFECYIKVDSLIKQIIKEKLPNIQVHTNWMSNGVWHNWERVKNLLIATDGKIGFSYDPIGRYFSEEQRNLVIENIEHFIDYYICTAITLTKPNIYALINGDLGFNKIPRQLNLEYNPYIPNLNWEQELPSDLDVYNFYKWAVENKHWAFSSIREIVKSAFGIKSQVYCSCRFAKQYSNGKLTSNCVLKSSKLNPSLFYGDKEVNESNCTDVKNSIALSKRKCLMCEYLNVCGMYCGTSIIFKYYKITKCPIKSLILFVKNKPYLLEEVKNWEDKYGHN